MTERSLSQVTANTCKKYAEQVLRFCEFVDQRQLYTDIVSMEGSIGVFLPSVPDKDLRMLSGGAQDCARVCDVYVEFNQRSRSGRSPRYVRRQIANV